ncbi:hypothetical protein [Arsenicicoccus sp. oral taxon 190]|uniref:hypothetical protein n=1 Tax=Arsenicicoccus sp. oral taxon 190 TaxID=1658671 RepID=UPI00067A37C9|nr:hypothetical protein [Arsenicicoccus sp. oral taxon 190]AKT50189.1 hypothetical protein ADJ73_00545 [Arsenicicoccus sp. oral taxon 190]
MPRHDRELALRQDLIDAGHMVELPLRGLSAFTGTFEDVLAGVERLVHEMEPTEGVIRMSFPPLLTQPVFERTGYLDSFPQLIGSVDVFTGDSREHKAMVAAKNAGEDWTTHLTPARLDLLSAPCHQTYPLHAGTRIDRAHVYETGNRCFRHEPSDDPMRLVSFRMREKVCIGTPEQAREHRELGRRVGPELLTSLGLEIEEVPANDPFFGRAAKIFAAGQRDAGLKVEFECKVYGADNPGVALGSSNYHNDHFGLDFDITTPDGEPAHSSCIGFGLERVTVALFATHGMDVPSWPAEVRGRLGLDPR